MVSKSRQDDKGYTGDDGGDENGEFHHSGGCALGNASSGPRMVSGPSSSNSEASICSQVASHGKSQGGLGTSFAANVSAPYVGARPPVVVVRVDGVKPPDRHIRSPSGTLADGTPPVDKEKPHPKAVPVADGVAPP